ncbi:DegT/DnrJ/EryC1/StrS family aminotransferase [Thalassospira xianhensis]|uniref:Aminotransferase n=1 Tax=Thalassospira xianhensis MCCC 1A02616 TaxID=1177929 RepID=A0A367UJ78_9PROT|nr:DegT/DnrJ/EryC1/StrS aminotransferase family protein [Thalassospira xianhensis]RCK07364.1 aminotransferase [Thalassospira xianhensis MCCC 1A02616]
MLNTPFSPWPSFSSEEAEAVSQTLLSNQVNYWTGEAGRLFEKEFAEWCQTRYAIALANGTLALDLALKGLGVGSGDEVIVTPRTFIASVSCVINAGATPVFADVDPNSGNITAETIKKVLSPRSKAVICVHLAGWPCDMDPIMALADEHDLGVVEDCAQAHGALYKGRPVGGIGHIGAWSFCQDKIMTTGGEGGMVTTDDEAMWRSMWAFKDHGKSYSAVYEKQHPPGFRWLHDDFGTNWRMLEMQAVIGRIQLRKMPGWSFARNKNALKLLSALHPFLTEAGPVRCPVLSEISSSGEWATSTLSRHAFYKFYLYVRPENLASGWNRDRILNEINLSGVPCYQGSCSEVYLEKAFADTEWRPSGRLPNAKVLGETSLMFLVHPTLTDAEITKSSQVLRNVLCSASNFR